MRIPVYYRALLPAILLLLAACGQRKKEERSSAASLQQQFGVAPLPADTTTSLIDTRPPIDEFGTPYLFPHEHPDLPKNIADWLSERGYVIPQLKPVTPSDSFGPCNVISGEFKTKGQKDWAVYCTNRKKTCVLVFWKGRVDSIDTIDKQPMYYNGKYKFTSLDMDCCPYYISVAPKKLILWEHKLASEYSNVKLPPIDHDGIDYGIFESGSDIFYFYENKWIVLPGSD